MSHNAPHILVIDGYPKSDRDNLAGCGMGTAGDLYTKMLARLCHEARFDVIFPSDPDGGLAAGVNIGDYDGVAWTGCSLTIHDDSDPRVARHIELARAAYLAGVPQYGTCWGIQIAAVAAGGTVAANPHGREMGLARKITLSPAGRGHPLYENKPTTFDGFVSHFDEVTHLPPGAIHLAQNSFTHVQAVTVTHKKGTFWGLQYHPEYDLFEMARLIYCRMEKLISEDFFMSRDQGEQYVEDLEQLHKEPERKALRWRLGVDADLIDMGVRTREVQNWFERLVIPGIRD